MATKRRDTDSLVRWRREQLIQAGMPRTLAGRVARDERYGLHDLIELLELGCAPGLALRILEPVERDDAALMNGGPGIRSMP
ncbi:MAG TPA: hypothetical protein VJ838_10795 [Gaiellaceae bacterium]|nr:hypothetical protein [Gaiellaceae bacterium]